MIPTSVRNSGVIFHVPLMLQASHQHLLAVSFPDMYCLHLRRIIRFREPESHFGIIIGIFQGSVNHFEGRYYSGNAQTVITFLFVLSCKCSDVRFPYSPRKCSGYSSLLSVLFYLPVQILLYFASGSPAGPPYTSVPKPSALMATGSRKYRKRPKPRLRPKERAR